MNKKDLLTERSVWQYWTLPVVNKLRVKLGQLSLIDERNRGEEVSGARIAIIGLVQGICAQAGIGASEIFPELATQSVQQTLKEPEISPQEDSKETEDESVGEEFEDRLHAIEEMGLPDSDKACLDMAKKDLIATIYTEDNEEAIAFLGLPKKSKKCNKEYTHKNLVEFLFQEEDE